MEDERIEPVAGTAAAADGGRRSSAGAGSNVDSRSTQMALLLDALIYAVAWTHVLLAPYTKVEESFTLHAMHDLLLYGGRPDALQKVRYNNFIVWRFPLRWAYPRSVRPQSLFWGRAPLIRGQHHLHLDR